MSMGSKSQLRAQFLAERDELDQAIRQDWDLQLLSHFMKHDKVIAANHVSCYVSYGNEINTVPILTELWRRGKQVSVPRIISKTEGMEMVSIQSMADLSEGKYGILAPSNEVPAITKSPDVILVPGLAFDREGYRIGYGGGFYDRFLALHPTSYTIALAYKKQMVQSLPREPFDISVDEVINP
jgi:5-formyltetrahydrofolate cyclo-ligase